MSEFSKSYAPPRGEVASVSTPDAADGMFEPQPWSNDDVLLAAWDLFKRHWTTLSGATLIGFGLVFAVQQVTSMMLSAVVLPTQESRGTALIVLSVGLLVSLAVQAAVMAGWATLFLRTAQYEKPSFGSFFSAFRLFPTMFVTMVACTVFTSLGLFFFVVPGIVIALSTCLYMFFVVEGDGTINALKASFSVTSDQKAALFVFFILVILLNLAGALALGVGLLVTTPVSFLALATVYVRVTGRQTPGTMLPE